MNLGENIKKARIKKGYSQAELAEKIGVSQAAIYYWENGKREPNFETIHKIANALDVSYIELMNNDFINLFSCGSNKDVIASMVNDMLGVNIQNNENKLLSKYRELNEDGQEKAIEQVELLTKIEEYRKKD